MKIFDTKTSTTTKEFGELPIGTVFEFPAGKYAECFGICMKINSADCDDNTIDLEDCTIFDTEADTKVYELNAHLVIEGRE